MSIINELKKILLDVNVNLTELAQALEKRLGKPYSMQNLSNKLRKETITHREMLIIADILGYDLKFIRREEKH
ncbi:TPA: LLM class flavin-dependent oxidoreductase [Candidatus Scatousia excrementigallinarum]|uniref:LLM class flavin-dependent oxidoreductase n=1 Tax=Candidatus Scatousia excrementigallinarum TaxID=2840935 RepID=A0A9D1EWE6_9BACT|nr:LLM class flavin-dependent oxidoreductase [Candidatus Scatousia excrementigallinarum]